MLPSRRWGNCGSEHRGAGAPGLSCLTLGQLLPAPPTSPHPHPRGLHLGGSFPPSSPLKREEEQTAQALSQTQQDPLPAHPAPPLRQLPGLLRSVQFSERTVRSRYKELEQSVALLHGSRPSSLDWAPKAAPLNDRLGREQSPRRPCLAASELGNGRVGGTVLNARHSRYFKVFGAIFRKGRNV